MKRLLGKTAIVTGSTRGIGRAIAIGYAREGANVVVSGRNKSLCEEVSGIIKSEGNEATGIACDISDFDEINNLYNITIQVYGKVDIAVNNAGIAYFKSFVDMDPGTATKIWNTNIFGTFFGGQRAAKEMIKQGHGGKIINMSSISSETAAPGLSAYAPTKAAISLMTKCMALELAKDKINVNAIGCGVVLTDINREVLADPKVEQYYNEKIPWGRVGQPEDLVGLSIFLATDESEYITGTTVFIDGGFMIE